jgi:hypothetical protein
VLTAALERRANLNSIKKRLRAPGMGRNILQKRSRLWSVFYNYCCFLQGRHFCGGLRQQTEFNNPTKRAYLKKSEIYIAPPNTRQALVPLTHKIIGRAGSIMIARFYFSIFTIWQIRI